MAATTFPGNNHYADENLLAEEDVDLSKKRELPILEQRQPIVSGGTRPRPLHFTICTQEVRQGVDLIRLI
jgi:hypothetical protein